MVSHHHGCCCGDEPGDCADVGLNCLDAYVAAGSFRVTADPGMAFMISVCGTNEFDVLIPVVRISQSMWESETVCLCGIGNSKNCETPSGPGDRFIAYQVRVGCTPEPGSPNYAFGLRLAGASWNEDDNKPTGIQYCPAWHQFPLQDCPAQTYPGGLGQGNGVFPPGCTDNSGFPFWGSLEAVGDLEVG